MTLMTLNNFLVLAFISELHLLLVSVGLTYGDMGVLYKKTFASALVFISFSYILICLRLVTIIIFICVILNLLEFSLLIQVVISILTCAYCWRVFLALEEKRERDYGIADSIICVIGFFLIWQV